MIKYIITKDIEVEKTVFDSEDIGVFDAEEDAIRMADSIYAGMSEFERQYYEVVVWKATGESIDPDDWDTFDECHSIAEYGAEVYGPNWELYDDGEDFSAADLDNSIQYCYSPEKDVLRLWIDGDTDEYVDRVCTGGKHDLAFALEDWYRKNGHFTEEDWKDCFPLKAREMYLDGIAQQGYSDEEALEILRYLAMTVGDSMPDNIAHMIELWKAETVLVEPLRLPSWKKKVLHDQKNMWEASLGK